MMRVGQIKAMVHRFLAAVRRHGIRRVGAIVFHAVLRHGLVGAFRFGQAARPFVSRVGSRFSAPPIHAPIVERKGRAPDLDQRYTIDASAWPLWKAAMLPVTVRRDGIDPAPMTFVVQGGAAWPDGAERTIAAIKAMNAECDVLGDGSAIQPLALPQDKFLVFLQAGDLPAVEFPLELARTAKRGITEVISFDLYRRIGERVQPLLLPGANPTLMGAIDYVFSRIALRGSAVPDGVQPLMDQPRALVLAWLKGRSVSEIRGRWRHVGRPLVEVALSDEAIQSKRQAVLEEVRRPIMTRSTDAVSVVICTKDKGHLTRQLVRQLLSYGPEHVAEIVIVSNGTTNPHALRTLSDLSLSPRVRVLRIDSAFNFSRLSNAGASATTHKGPLLFINDDIVPVSEDWLERLVARLQQPGVGCVGPLLIYPDERVQHAGMYLGYFETAGHTLRHARLPDDDYLFTASAPREVSCLTGAVILTSRALFEALNGFDDQLATYLQDVDYGLRVHRAGFCNIFEPASILIHMESASIHALEGNISFNKQRHIERLRFLERWGDALKRDPFHSPGFDVQDETLRSLAKP